MVNEDHQESPFGPVPLDWHLFSLLELEKKRAIWIKNGFAQGNHNQSGIGVPHLRPFNVLSNGISNKLSSLTGSQG